MKYAFLLIFIGISFFTSSQTTVIKGSSKDYIGDSIPLYTYSDYITKNVELLSYLKVDSNGYFRTEINIDEITYVFSYLGILKAEMYILPNTEIYILLPKLIEKQPQDKLNPYFKYTVIPFKVLDEKTSDFNACIWAFDTKYNEYVSKFFNEIYNKALSTDSFRKAMNKEFKKCDNSFFNNYKTYRYAELNFLGPARDYKAITQYFYKNKEILYNNPAYMHLFNNMFKEFFYFYPETKKGKEIKDNIIKAKSITKLKRTLSKEIAFDDERLQELIILKGIYDAFLPDVPENMIRYPKAQLYQTLDSLMILTKIPEHKQIAENIIEKINLKGKIAKGNELPDITLLNQDSVEVRLKDIKSKYIYLSITMTNCISCKRDMEIIKTFSEKYKEDIIFVSIVLNGKISDLKKFTKENSYNWIFLHYGYNKSIRKLFDAETIPKYILVNPYGKIVLSSAPPPGDRFTKAFRKIIKTAY